MAADHCTYLLVDGENIDGVLSGLLGSRKPEPGQRPRWQEVLRFTQEVWGQPVKALFFINSGPAPLKQGVLPFVQALVAMDFTPIPLAGTGAEGEKVVDIGIQRTLEAISHRPGDVMLASHDGDFAHEIRALQHDGRKVGILAFQEFVSAQLRDAAANTVFDLEDDAGAFPSVPLRRIRVIPLDKFDPERFL